MQNYKYTKFFQPSENYNEKFTSRFLDSLKSFTETMTDDPPPPTINSYLPWTMPYQKKLRDDYYNILYIYAKACQVKLMWRKMLPPDASTISKGLWIIGDHGRVQIFGHLANHYFNAYFQYQ